MRKTLLLSLAAATLLSTTMAFAGHHRGGHGYHAEGKGCSSSTTLSAETERSLGTARAEFRYAKRTNTPLHALIDATTTNTFDEAVFKSADETYANARIDARIAFIETRQSLVGTTDYRHKRGHGKGFKKGHKGGKGFMGHRLADALELSADQMRTIDKARVEMRYALSGVTFTSPMQSAMSTGTFNKTTFKTTALANEALKRNARTAFMKTLYTTLNENQKLLLKERVARMANED